ncbi:MAG: arsenite methyltransferase [Patescibacteria group bacterium]|nr:arsenite methyltransferase [Patescibacteria group bacterium]
MKNRDIKKIVRDNYGKVAKQNSSCCGGCSPTQDISQKIGYTKEELTAVPKGANLGLGCGNPVALASLKEGETVLDLGSGAGFDCFLAANKVGKKGKVIGVDMTPEMIEKAKHNAQMGNYQNVEFKLGDIEHLPIDDNFIDIIISNCVINLSPDKKNVFSETFRVLKPGGRLMISDIVLLKRLPDSIRSSIEAYVGCIAGAVEKKDYLAFIKEAGFHDVKIIAQNTIPINSMVNNPAVKAIMKNLKMPQEQFQKLATSIASVRVFGIKPD